MLQRGLAADGIRASKADPQHDAVEDLAAAIEIRLCALQCERGWAFAILFKLSKPEMVCHHNERKYHRGITARQPKNGWEVTILHED